MKILMLSHYFPPEVNAPAKRTYEHARIFVAEGHEVTIITNFPNHPMGKIFPGYINKLQQYEKIDGMNVIRVFSYLAENKKIIKRTINYIIFMVLAVLRGQRIKNQDIIFATSPQLFCGVAGMLLAKINNKPFILEIRDIWPDSIFSVGLLQKKRYIYRILKSLEYLIVKSAKIVITVTPGIYSYIQNIRNSNVVLIPNGVVVENYRPNQISDKKDHIIFAYIGTIGMAHNVDIIIEVAKYFQNNNKIRFLIVGDGAERHNIFNKAAKLPNISTLSLVSSKKVINIINNVDVGIVTLLNDPLWKHALPSKMFEFLILEKPVILSMPIGDAADIVKKSNCGLIADPANPDALIKEIKTYIANPGLIKLHGKNGRDFVKNEYDRTKLAHKLINYIIKKS